MSHRACRRVTWACTYTPLLSTTLLTHTDTHTPLPSTTLLTHARAHTHTRDLIFLSREGRDLGVAFQAPPGSQASSRGQENRAEKI